MTSFTVIVPTRNRADTLEYALQTLVEIDDDRLDILVSDNASDDQTRDVVASCDDPRVRYFNTGRRLGMSQNWEFALSHASGDWVGFLGDDDGLLPDALERVRAIAAETGVRAVRAAILNYAWPSLSRRGVGILQVPLGGKIEVRNAKEDLMSVLTGREHYTRLPVLYNGGFAAREVIEGARDASGRFFGSRIPDLYSGIVLAHFLDSFAWSDVPFAVNGASAHSTGSSQFTRSTDPARLRPSQVFLQEDNLPFHPSVPLDRDDSLPKSLQALVLESWYQAHDRFPDIPGVEPRRQLRAVGESVERFQDIAGWTEDFARLHGLDASAALRGTGKARLRRRGGAFMNLAWNGNWHSGLAPDQPVSNVAEATRLAARVLGSSAPARLLPIRNLARVGSRMVGAALTKLGAKAGSPALAATEGPTSGA